MAGRDVEGVYIFLMVLSGIRLPLLFFSLLYPATTTPNIFNHTTVDSGSQTTNSFSPLNRRRGGHQTITEPATLHISSFPIGRSRERLQSVTAHPSYSTPRTLPPPEDFDLYRNTHTHTHTRRRSSLFKPLPVNVHPSSSSS